MKKFIEKVERVEFTEENYNDLLKLLDDDASVITPIQMELKTLSSEGVKMKNCNVSLRVASRFAPKNPVIEFDKQDGYGNWFKIKANGGYHEMLIEVLGESTDYNINIDD